MGQKVNPHGIRVGVIKDWSSKWYAGKDFADFLVEDYKIREFLKKKLYDAGVGSIDIERTSDRVIIIVSTSQPGIVIGKGGADVDRLKVEVQKLSKQKVDLKVKEIKKADLNAQLVAEKIAKDLEARISFRRAMKSAMGRTMKNGAKGIKTSVSGRLGGADMARSTARELFLFRHFVQTSSMVLQRLTQPMVRLVLSAGSTLEKFFLLRETTKRKGAINNVNA